VDIVSEDGLAAVAKAARQDASPSATAADRGAGMNTDIKGQCHEIDGRFLVYY